MKTNIIAFVLIAVLCELSQADDFYAAKGTVLFGEDFRRRLLIEPGSTLKVNGSIESDYGSMYRVTTATGISGLMHKDDVHKVKNLNTQVASVKYTNEIYGVTFISGKLHPYKATNVGRKKYYEVVTGLYRYDIEAGLFKKSEPETLAMEAKTFLSRFNKLENSEIRFWRAEEDISGKPAKQKYGCGTSQRLVKFAKASASASAEATSSFNVFLNWLKVNLSIAGEASAGVERETTIESSDSVNMHQLTFWTLEDSKSDVVLHIVMDRISACPGAGASSKISYHFKFPNSEIDDFKLEQGWEYWKHKTLDSPITISTMKDYFELKKAIAESGILTSRSGKFKYEAHLRDFIIKNVVTILPPPN